MRSMTAVSKRLGKIDMIVDKLHFRNRVDRHNKANWNPHDLNKLYAVRYRIAFVLIVFFLFVCLFLLLLFFCGEGGQKYIITIKEMGQIAA